MLHRKVLRMNRYILAFDKNLEDGKTHGGLERARAEKKGE